MNPNPPRWSNLPIAPYGWGPTRTGQTDILPLAPTPQEQKEQKEESILREQRVLRTVNEAIKTITLPLILGAIVTGFAIAFGNVIGTTLAQRFLVSGRK